MEQNVHALNQDKIGCPSAYKLSKPQLPLRTSMWLSLHVSMSTNTNTQMGNDRHGDNGYEASGAHLEEWVGAVKIKKIHKSTVQKSWISNPMITSLDKCHIGFGGNRQSSNI